MAYKDKARASKMQNKWIAQNYDRINLTIPKGQKDAVKAHADTRHESMNSFIWRAIQNQIEADKKKEAE